VAKKHLGHLLFIEEIVFWFGLKLLILRKAKCGLIEAGAEFEPASLGKATLSAGGGDRYGAAGLKNKADFPIGGDGPRWWIWIAH
jgi:hypothetical protein